MIINSHGYCTTPQRYILIGEEIVPENYVRNKVKESLDEYRGKEYNYTIILKKESRKSIGRQFGQCANYRTDGQRLGATSQTQCYRNCLKQLYINRFKCVPLFVDNLLHESDINYLMTTGIKLCETSPQMLKHIRNIEPNVCRNKCPDDCRKVYYSSEKRLSIEYIGNQKWYDMEWHTPMHRRFVWDNQPMFAYIEEPVLTFTQFVVNCGGLMGLWFGKSTKDLMVWIVELNALNRIKNLIGIVN